MLHFRLLGISWSTCPGTRDHDRLPEKISEGSSSRMRPCGTRNKALKYLALHGLYVMIMVIFMAHQAQVADFYGYLIFGMTGLTHISSPASAARKSTLPGRLPSGEKRCKQSCASDLPGRRGNLWRSTCKSCPLSFGGSVLAMRSRRA